MEKQQEASLPCEKYREEGMLSSAIPLIDRKRKEDLTVEELHELACFRQYTQPWLKQFIESLKTYTRTVLYIHRKEHGRKKSPVKLVPDINKTKKAA